MRGNIFRQINKLNKNVKLTKMYQKGLSKNLHIAIFSCTYIFGLTKEYVCLGKPLSYFLSRAGCSEAHLLF